MAQAISTVERQRQEKEKRTAIERIIAGIKALMASIKELFTKAPQQEGQATQQARPGQQKQVKQAQGQRTSEDIKASIKSTLSELGMQNNDIQMVASSSEKDRGKQLIGRSDIISNKADTLNDSLGKAGSKKELLAVEASANKALFIASKVLTDDEKQSIGAKDSNTVDTYKKGLDVLNSMHDEAKNIGNNELVKNISTTLSQFEGTDDKGTMDNKEDEMSKKIQEFRDEFIKIEDANSQNNKSEIQKVLDGDMSIESLGEALAEQNPSMSQQATQSEGQAVSVSM